MLSKIYNVSLSFYNKNEIVMKNFLFAFLLFVSLPIAGRQAEDTAVVSVEYKSAVRLYEGESPSEVYYRLDVGCGMSRFYCPKRELSEAVSDSLNAANADGMQVLDIMRAKNLPGASTAYTVYKNYPDRGRLTFTDYVANYFKYEEPMADLGWTPEEGDSVVCGYDCKKASATLRGRKWTVWYTVDIPAQDGPWKLYGLPGLILRAADEDRNFIFEAVAVEKSGVKIAFDDTRSYQKCTPRELQEQYALFEESRLGYLFKMAGVKKNKQTEALSRRTNPKKPCLMEFYE